MKKKNVRKKSKVKNRVANIGIRFEWNKNENGILKWCSNKK